MKKNERSSTTNKVSYDKKKDILYIMLRHGIEEHFEDISENITVEYDAQDRPIGIEIFNASQILPSQVKLSHSSSAIAHQIKK